MSQAECTRAPEEVPIEVKTALTKALVLAHKHQAGAESPALRTCLTALEVMHAAAVTHTQIAFATYPPSTTSPPAQTALAATDSPSKPSPSPSPSAADKDPRTTPLVLHPLVLRV
ncbi:hypothetical protein H0H81_010655 [Sphagnurus paluster]|uniref:Uncharacterized protein n=1 Tax=Sphagnurus paluster TaxID=117069 RepID=A0A9P7FRE8_9AGAR|nr:hypothetical protein H0H81_010655 [Sphagnurus paluster]